MDVQRKSLRQINDRVMTLEKLMIDSHILLEKIRSTIQQDDKSLPESHKFIHILSRESPYIYTNEPRFPVTEKYIAWKVSDFSKIEKIKCSHRKRMFRCRSICTIQLRSACRKRATVSATMNVRSWNRICKYCSRLLSPPSRSVLLDCEQVRQAMHLNLSPMLSSHQPHQSLILERSQ